MLDHSPPLPLIIDYDEEDDDITAEDEEAIIRSLEQRDRVRRIRLRLPVETLQKLIVAINEEYPILEFLILASLEQGDTVQSVLMLPEALQAPHLRHLLLGGFSLPIGFRLLTTAVGLITICLAILHPSTYFHPNTLLRWISFMPQLETLVIFCFFPVLNRDVERQLMRTPITTHVTLPTSSRWYSKVPALTWKRLFDTSPPLVSRSSELSSQPTHVFRPMSPAVYEHNRESQVQSCPAPVL
jgi:hypothetical protein